MKDRIYLLLLLLKQEKAKMFLLFSLFLVSFFSVLYAISLGEGLLKLKERWESCVDLDNVIEMVNLRLIMQPGNISSETEQLDEKYNAIFQMLKEEDVVERAGMCRSSRLKLESGSQVKNIICNEDFFAVAKYDLIEGSLPAFSESSGTIDSLVSYEMGKEFPVGSCFSDEEGKKYRTTGILRQNTLVIEGMAAPLPDAASRADEAVIVTKTKTVFSQYDHDYGIVAFLKSTGISSDEAVERIGDAFQQVGTQIEVSLLREYYDQLVKGRSPQLIMMLIFSIMILALSFLGCVGMIMLDLRRHHKEYGLYLSLGLERGRLKNLIGWEFGLVVTAAFISAVILAAIYLKHTYMDPEIVKYTPSTLMDGRIILVGLLIVLVFFIMSFYRPFREIQGMTPDELIREKE